MASGRGSSLGWAGRIGAALLSASTFALWSCKPAAFASARANLMREPPPLLSQDSNAFWNDPATGVYGEFSVGPGLFRHTDALCRSARVTSIDDTHQTRQDQTLLYCASRGGPFQLDATLACRPGGVIPGLICRQPDGDDVTLPPA